MRAGIIVAGKMVLLPGAALLFATLLYHTIGNGGLDTFALRNPTDRTVYFVTMLLAGAPTAPTAGVTLAGGMQKAVGAVLYAEYAIMASLRPHRHGALAVGRAQPRGRAVALRGCFNPTALFIPRDGTYFRSLRAPT